MIHSLHFGHAKARSDVVDLLDRVYELRNGSGVGVARHDSANGATSTVA